MTLLIHVLSVIHCNITYLSGFSRLLSSLYLCISNCIWLCGMPFSKKKKKKKEGLGMLISVYFACSTQNKIDYSFVAACRLCKTTSSQYLFCEHLLLQPACPASMHQEVPLAARHHSPWNGTSGPWAATWSWAGPTAAGIVPWQGKFALQWLSKEHKSHDDKLFHRTRPCGGPSYFAC